MLSNVEIVRVLNKSGNPTDQAHNAEPEKNADQHSHVQIEIYGDLRGRGVWHRIPRAFPHYRDDVIAR